MTIEVITIRIPSELKKKMKELSKEVEWSKEIREFISKRIEEIEREKAIEELIEYVENLPKASPGTSAKLVRESVLVSHNFCKDHKHQHG